MGRVIYRIVLAVGIVFLCSCHMSAVKGYIKDSNPSVTVSPRKSFSRQLTQSNTTYVINHIIDLKGETIIVPYNATLYFKKGMLRNGELRGNYKIESTSKQIFDNVDISTYQYPIMFTWLVGGRRDLYNRDFQGLPNVLIDFGDIQYYAKETIKLDNLKGFHFANLKLKTSYSVQYWQSTIKRGLCATSGNKIGFQNDVITQDSLPAMYKGYVIEIATADETKLDSRTNKDGVPTLYKGLTSRILQLDGKIVTMSDSIESFSRERRYNNHKVQSIYRIYEPRKYVMSNCHFVFSNKSGMSLYGSDFLIDNCSFEAVGGSEAILSIGGCGGFIKSSIIKGAYFEGSHTSYGIQVNKGSNIVIEDCEFYENRRGVDFSGSFESRYNIVRNCTFHQEHNEGKTGSALGGHSTSYGNIYRNNKIYGDYQIGIECRGEKEIVDNNYFECMAVWIIQFGYNTQITNNRVVMASNYAAGIFAGSPFQADGNTLDLEKNDVDVRVCLINGDSKTKYKLRNNKIRFRPNVASIKPVLFLRRPEKYEVRDNEICCTRNDVKVRFIEGVDLPKKR